ncbi:serine--tRNA ligase [bacterium]|nr:serine--tRNA ligase [bacterium]
MINISLFREDPEHCRARVLKKSPDFNFDELLELDAKVREFRIQVDDLRKQRKDLAAAGSKGVTDEQREQAREVGKKIKDIESELADVEASFKNLALCCPNIPEDDVPEGNKESNKSLKEFGDKPEFGFKVKNHLELNEKLGWLDFESAANMSGGQFVVYRGDGLKMIYALVRLMLRNNAKCGFEPVGMPQLVCEQALFNSGNLPKFRGDFYEVPSDGLCVIPTAEVPLTNVYANKILDGEKLPIRMTAWTQCFRREAGGYGSAERGLIRIHQFDKVELYSLVDPEKSFEELDVMVSCAEQLLKDLGLHYRISLLAAQDCSFASAKTFDIEVWLPGQDKYYEVSSCSNCTDFQARRAAVRFRKSSKEKPKLVHTLNASSLAIPRLMVALIETFQNDDGTVTLPDVLQREMDALW